MQDLIDKARVLVEALPYMSKFRGLTVVVKVGGHAMDDPGMRARYSDCPARSR